jgi:hypothetical protein
MQFGALLEGARVSEAEPQGSAFPGRAWERDEMCVWGWLQFGALLEGARVSVAEPQGSAFPGRAWERGVEPWERGQ